MPTVNFQYFEKMSSQNFVKAAPDGFPSLMFFQFQIQTFSEKYRESLFIRGFFE
jgi:hypothetical protein